MYIQHYVNINYIHAYIAVIPQNMSIGGNNSPIKIPLKQYNKVLYIP